jgi:hypothetical protein
MPHFESPLGKQKIASAPFKEFEVPDESGYVESAPRSRSTSIPDESTLNAFQAKMQEEDPAVIEQQVWAAKAARQGKERLNDGARRRIEMLVGMTCSTREVVIGENVFVLQTLRSKEMREAMMATAATADGIQSLFESRRQLLARSIKQVAGMSIELFLGDTSLDSKLAFVDEQDDALLDRLWFEYSKLTEEAKNKFAVKTEEDVKEVIADLKK